MPLLGTRAGASVRGYGLTNSGLLGSTGPGGGIIFYIAPTTFIGGPSGTAMKYLEAAPSGWNVGSDPFRTWSTGGNQTTAVSGADGTAIGTGYQNSVDIANQSGNVSATCAAVLARNYTPTVSGVTYTDWYLPSQDELNELFNKKSFITGLWSSFIYYSSTEVSSSTARYQDMGSGATGPSSKNLTQFVRPIRAFNL
jgi:hypothetical protein